MCVTSLDHELRMNTFYEICFAMIASGAFPPNTRGQISGKELFSR